MFKKFNKFLDTPITWRSSLKASVYVMGLEVICFGVYGIYKHIEYKRFEKSINRSCENIKKDIREKWATETTEETEG